MNPADSISLQYHTTYLNTAPQALEQNGNGYALNYTLSVPEAAYLAFVIERVKLALDQKIPLIYLGTTEKMQSDFKKWRVETLNSKIEQQYTSEAFSLLVLVSSIWMKTKTQVENELLIYGNPEESEHEKHCQDEADKATKNFWLQGHLGKVFTERQAQFLITAANNMGNLV